MYATAPSDEARAARQPLTHHQRQQRRHQRQQRTHRCQQTFLQQRQQQQHPTAAFPPTPAQMSAQPRTSNTFARRSAKTGPNRFVAYALAKATLHYRATSKRRRLQRRLVSSTPTARLRYGFGTRLIRTYVNGPSTSSSSRKQTANRRYQMVTATFVERPRTATTPTPKRVFPAGWST